MIRAIVISALLLPWVALDVFGQSSNVALRPLSLRECLGLALEHNLTVQVERLASPEAARYTWKASRGIYDPVLTLNAAKTFLDQPAQFDPKKTGTDAEYELESDPVGASLNGRLPYGLQYGLSSVATYAHVFTMFPSNIFNLSGPAFAGFPDGLRRTNAWFQATEMTLSQPLLRDFWIDIYSTAIQVNKKYLEIAELTFKALVMTNIVAVETNYYNLIRDREQIRVQQKSLELSSELLREVRKQVQVGTLAELDTQQAESAVETARSQLAGAEGAYATAKNVLKNLISENLQEWMNVDIEPSENLIAVNVPTDARESWMNALHSRPDLVAMRLGLEQTNIYMRFFYNQLFPALNVNGSYGWLEEQHSFSDAFSELRHGANANYSAGVTLSVPLGNVTARNNYKGQKVAKQQGVLRLNRLQQDIITEVDNTVKTVQYTYQQVGATRKAREFAEAALAAETKRLTAGQVAPFIVLEFQRNVTAARTAEVVALADFNRAKAQLALSEGTILQQHKINLKMH